MDIRASKFEIIETKHHKRTRRNCRAEARAVVHSLANQALKPWGIGSERRKELADCYADTLSLLFDGDGAVFLVLAFSLASSMGAHAYHAVAALAPKPKRPWWLPILCWKIPEYRRREQQEARKWKLAAIAAAAIPFSLASLFVWLSTE